MKGNYSEIMQLCLLFKINNSERWYHIVNFWINVVGTYT